MVHVFRRMLDNLIGSTKIHNNKRKKQCHNKKAIGAERNIQQNQLQFDMAV
jgi:hypothetical protein